MRAESIIKLDELESEGRMHGIVAPITEMPKHTFESFFISGIVIDLLLQFDGDQPRTLSACVSLEEWKAHRSALLDCHEDHTWLVNAIDALLEVPEAIEELTIEHLKEIGAAVRKMSEICTVDISKKY